MDVWQIVKDVGIFAGVIAAAIGYWVRLQAEKKRLLRKVLYYLLEVRYIARFLSEVPEEFKAAYKDTYFAEWKKYGVDCFKEADEEVFDEILNVALRKVAAAKASMPPEFVASFYTSLDLLAERYPITAYQLRGSQQLGDLLNCMNDINISVQEMCAPILDDPEQLKVMDMTQGAVTEAGFSDQIKELDTIIRNIAWQCSFRQWRYARQILKNVKWEYTSNDRKMIEDLVESAVKAIVAVLKADDAGEPSKKKPSPVEGENDVSE